MTTTTDFDGLVAHWLEIAGPVDIRREVVDAAVATVRRTRPRSRLAALLVGPAAWPRSPRRRYAFADLPPAVRVGVVLALLAAAIAGSIIAGGRSLFPPPPPRVYDGIFVPTGTPSGVHIGGPLIALRDGRVLMGNPEGPSIWDPTTGRWTDTGQMATKSSQSIDVVVLRDGRVLFIGGQVLRDVQDGSRGYSVPTGPPTAELYDPRTGTFTATGSPQITRWGARGVLLADGRVLVAGGNLVTGNPDGNDAAVERAEVYDPASGTFSVTGSMTIPRSVQSMTLMGDGRVLVLGGQDTQETAGPGYVSSADVFDPGTGTFAPAGAADDLVVTPDAGHYPFVAWGPAVALHDGRVLIAGLACQEGTMSFQGSAPRASRIFDRATGRFQPGPRMPHCVKTATMLPDGHILLTAYWGPVWSGLFDPTTGDTRDTARPPGGNYIHLAPLPDGRVLFLGERYDGAYPPSFQNVAEIYQ